MNLQTKHLIRPDTDIHCDFLHHKSPINQILFLWIMELAFLFTYLLLKSHEFFYKAVIQ